MNMKIIITCNYENMVRHIDTLPGTLLPLISNKRKKYLLPRNLLDSIRRYEIGYNISHNISPLLQPFRIQQSHGNRKP